MMVDGYRTFQDYNDAFIRIGEFELERKGRKDPESLSKAGFMARTNTLDFRQTGAKIASLKLIAGPYFNAGLQAQRQAWLNVKIGRFKRR